MSVACFCPQRMCVTCTMLHVMPHAHPAFSGPQWSGTSTSSTFSDPTTPFSLIEQERQLQTMLDEVCERENQLVAQMTELQQLKASPVAGLLSSLNDWLDGPLTWRWRQSSVGGPCRCRELRSLLQPMPTPYTYFRRCCFSFALKPMLNIRQTLILCKAAVYTARSSALHRDSKP